jgi:NADH-quinone oxidoreductase subunit J
MPETLIFYVLSALAIGASALVVGQRNPMYSVLLLIASFGALAGLYIQLDAPFVAVAQIIIYAGAIMVLFLFVVMLLNAPQEDGADWDRSHPLRKPRIAAFGALLAVLLVTQLGWAVTRIAGLEAPVASRGDAGTISSVAELGRILFQRHGFAFEATSILILVAMIGAVVLARREAPDQQGEAPDPQELEERR